MMDDKPINPVQHIIKFIAGLWYSPAERVFYYFHFIDKSEYGELLKTNEENMPALKSKYRVLKESNQYILEIDNKKFPIIKLQGTPTIFISFRADDGTIFFLQKL